MHGPEQEDLCIITIFEYFVQKGSQIFSSVCLHQEIMEKNYWKLSSSEEMKKKLSNFFGFMNNIEDQGAQQL